MKRFLVIVLLCLLSAVLRGATPAFTSFIGSNAVTVVSNPVTGKIVFSAPTAGQSSFGASNFFTTNCIVTANGDTNRIVVSGFGTAQANGTYRINTTAGTWTNVADRTIAFVDVSGDGNLTNATGILYESIGGWPPNGNVYDPVLGAAPGGTPVYDSATNCLSYAYGLEPRTNVIYINCGDSNVLQKISNAPNNSIIFVGPCSTGYVYASWAWSTNRVAAPFSLVNKTNVEIHGYGMPVFNSSQTPFADGMHISNCSRITIRGIQLENVRVTNFTTMPNFFDTKYAAALHYFVSEHILIEDCRFVNWWNHGILDGSAAANAVAPSTNNIIVRRNYFRNGGSYHATPAVFDGVAWGGCGGVIEQNYIEEWAHGVEPFAVAGAPLVFNVRILNNHLRNIISEGIRNATSTNMFNVEISGNTIEYDIGYVRGSLGNFGTNLNIAVPIQWTAGAGAVMRNNRIINGPNYGIMCYGGGAPTLGDLIIENNTIINTTNHVSATTAIGIVVGGSAAPQRFVIRNNEINVTSYEAIRIQGANNGVIEGNHIINAGAAGAANQMAVYVGAFDTASSNIVVRNNTIEDRFATPRCSFGIQVGETTGAGVRKIFLLDNRIQGMATALVKNTANYETAVDGTWPLGTTNLTALVSGRYTNNAWDRVVGIPGATTTIGRTNLLPNAALSNYFTWPITVWDRGTNASGTNVWIATVASQTINGGPTITNITTDNGSITLQPDGNGNWRIINAYP